MNITRRLFHCIAAGTLLLASMAADDGLYAQDTKVPENRVLRVAVHADLRTLDQAQTTAYITQRFGAAVYDTLFAFNSKLEPQPQMLDTYSLSDDGLTYTFTLRDGLQWHDGQPVRSADCIASLARWMDYDPMGQTLKGFLARMEPVDDKTFKMILKQPWSLTLMALSKLTGAPLIMPERVAKTPADTPITNHIGSGPFLFKADEWVPGSKVVFVRNPDYVPRKEPADLLSGGKVVNFDRIEWYYFPDDNTALSAFQAGEVDYYEQPPLQYLPILKADPNVEMKVLDIYGNLNLLRPNHTIPPFNNVKARQALLHLINQSEIMQAVVGDPDYYLSFCGAYFLCGSENETSVGSEVLRHPDVAKAQELMKEAGYKGEPIIFMLPTDRPTYQAASMVLIQTLRDAGLNIQPVSGDWSTLTGLRNKKEGWNLFVTTSAANAATPISSTYFNSRCEDAAPGWACDPKLMEIMEKWSMAPNAEERKNLLDEMQLRAYESVPFIPIGQFFQPVVYHQNIHGVLKAGIPVYWNITKD
ncbi:ABC transporter substrate-binding protein [Pseudochelatococcus sp. B33]